MARKREFDEAVALGQAMELFWKQGYEKTSMEDLVSAMGVHRKSIYDTFGNKHDLFIKALAYYKETVSQEMLMLIESENTALGKIRTIFEYAIRNNQVIRKGCLIVNAGVELSPHDEAIFNVVLSNFIDTEKVICQLLEQGQASGEFSSTLDLQGTTQFIHNALIGIRVQTKTTDDLNKLKSIIDLTMSILTETRKEGSYESSSN